MHPTGCSLPLIPTKVGTQGRLVLAHVALDPGLRRDERMMGVPHPPAVFGPSGRVATNSAHASSTAPVSQNHNAGGCAMLTRMKDAVIIPIDRYFALRGIAPCLRQATTVGPYFGWFSIHASSLREERAKHPAARIRKIVPGITGRM